MKTKKPTIRGISESNLLKLRRQVVLANFNDCCFFCGQHKNSVPLEDHHLVKRRTLLLKYDWRNGIPVCKYVCHSYAETPTGKAKIADYLRAADLLNYLQERSGQAKQWFTDHGLTKNDFLSQMLDDLKRRREEQKIPF